jgi:hypothetical protein
MSAPDKPNLLVEAVRSNAGYEPEASPTRRARAGRAAGWAPEAARAGALAWLLPAGGRGFLAAACPATAGRPAAGSAQQRRAQDRLVSLPWTAVAAQQRAGVRDERRGC